VLTAHDLSASALPEGTLCLTFDDGPGVTDGDGPGPKSDRLAEYLADEAIPATFFMCGKYVDALPHVAARIHALGHVVGNHTWSHPELNELTVEEVVTEVTETHRSIREATGVSARYFRAPYGRWSTAAVTALNADPLIAEYVGPINWDVNAEDWSFWRDGRPPADCVAAYSAAVASVGAGIVLMHDCTADEDTWQRTNATYEVIRVLVPELRALGYRFVSLADVPLSPVP
jgi:peptidoglycan/xylan/chitin deacetylase (PgdA/CDA1 family)